MSGKVREHCVAFDMTVAFCCLEALSISPYEAVSLAELLEVFLFSVRLNRLTTVIVDRVRILNKDRLHVFSKILI